MKLILRIYSIYPNTCKILSFQHAAPAPFLGLRSHMGLLAVVQGGAFRRQYDVLIRVSESGRSVFKSQHLCIQSVGPWPGQ